MEWQAFLASLAEEDRPQAERFAVEYGQEAANRCVGFHPVRSLAGLEKWLQKDRQKVKSRVAGLYESIDVQDCPSGWDIKNRVIDEEDSTQAVQTDVVGPNGAPGFFERAYNATEHQIELREAFVWMNGMTEALPTWVEDVEVPMVPDRGTPTIYFFTLYQLKLLNVGLAKSIKMSRIQNIETNVHLHWLRRRHPTASLSELIAHTASVDYATTIAIQCGYRVSKIEYVLAKECEVEIGALMDHFEDGNPKRRTEHDNLLAQHDFDRSTVMKMAFDIKLSLVPA